MKTKNGHPEKDNAYHKRLLERLVIAFVLFIYLFLFLKTLFF